MLKEAGIRKETIENCLYVLAKGKASEIEKILKVLKEAGIRKEMIENCLYVLARGKASEIEEILKVLKKAEIGKETIENSLYVLARGKASEIEKTLKVLKASGIGKETIENCLSVLAMGKASEIEKILKVLKEAGIRKKTTENCLSVLAIGKAREIEKTLKVLKEAGIRKETIENCLYVLAKGKARDIKGILKVLEENNLNPETINSNYGWIFRNDIVFKVLEQKNKMYIKKYMILKGNFNRCLNEQEIKSICNEKGITFYELLEALNRHFYKEQMKETLKKKGNLYFGKSIPISSNFMNKNGERILNLAKKTARNFSYKYKIKDYQEIESEAIEIILNKCGEIEQNYDNIEIMERIMYSKVFQFLKRNLSYKKNILIGIEESRNIKLSASDKIKEEISLSDWNVTCEQRELLITIAQYIEDGYDFEEIVETISEESNMDLNEIMQEIEKIKKNNKEKEKGEI